MATLVDTMRGFGQIKLALMAAVALALIAGFAMLTMRISSPALSPLFTNLTPEDSAKISTELSRLGVPYDVQAEGANIMVPAERVLRLRMNMAELGLPASGNIVGYEIFDKSETFGASNFVMNVNMMRALEGELARTVSAFQQVENARVHLVVPKRELFIKDKQETSASVALKLRGGQELEKSEVAAITHLVAAAVPGLKPSRISVVDSYGRLLARGDGQESIGAVAQVAEDYRVGYETRTKYMLEELLERVVGPGKVKVQVAAEINFDRVETSRELFDPESQVARSVQSTNETERAKELADGDDVSVANQLPPAQAGGGAEGGSAREMERSDETTNFEISKTMERKVKEGGDVKRLSVAVLVDGIYTGEGEEKTYTPRDEVELAKLAQLVQSAIAFDAERGDAVEVVNMQFTRLEDETLEDSFMSSFRYEMQGIIQTLIIAGVVILALLVVVRPAMQYMMKSAGNSSAGGGSPGMPELPGGGGYTSLPGAAAMNPVAMAAGGNSGGGGEMEDEDDTMVNLENVKGRIRSSTLKRVVNTVDKNPDEAMNVVRQWLIKEAS